MITPECHSIWCWLFTGILHVSYAPEYETIDDVQAKFQQRQSEVKFRMRLNKRKQQFSDGERKRKHSCDDPNSLINDPTADSPGVQQKQFKPNR